MSLLIVSHVDEIWEKLQRYLEAGGFTQLFRTASVEETFKVLGVAGRRAELLDVELLVIDMGLPNPGSLALCRILKEKTNFQDLPIIVMSSNEGVKGLTAAFSFGAIDYINNPPNQVETLTRVRAALRLKEEMDIRKAREHELLEVTKNLAAANQSLRKMVFLDGLTGIANRRYFDEFLQKEWRRAERTHNTMALLMIDIDHFKSYNDCYGHQDGDDCLKLVAKTLENTLKRPGDHAVRYGGEEFAVILAEDIDGAGALAVAENLRANVAALAIEHRDSSVADHVTVSVGVALSYPDSTISPESLISFADQALYDAKHAGRNQVIIAAKPLR